MLDDLKMIHYRDAQDALGVAEKQWQQLLHKYEVTFDKIDKGLVQNVVVAGMGGSALAAELFKSWPAPAIPFEVSKDYDIPNYVNKNTLFIASSYSGNTEETLSAISRAADTGCQMAVIASGGKLAEIASEHDYPFFQLPTGYQPRMAVFYNFAALVDIYEKITGSALSDELADTAKWLSEQNQQLLADVSTKNNPAKSIALDILGSSVVIYSGPFLAPAAYKWKININENAKTVAWWNTLPEFNHNEFLGWTQQPIEKPYKIIDLRSSFDHPRVQKRFDVTERLLSGKRPAAKTINAQGESKIQQLLWTVQLGDFVSLYLALLSDQNPTPVDLIEKLKKTLEE